MATLLDDRLVAGAMENLDDWTGDAERISRTLQVKDAEGLIAAVCEAADAMDHHPQIERNGDEITFVLWTHSAGGVTELDIALASRINDLVLTGEHMQRSASGQLRSVVGAPTDDGAQSGRTVTADPTFPSGGQTTPSRPEESTTGDPYPSEAAAGRDAPTLNEPGAPRNDAGPVLAPDSAPGSIEPQPGNAPAPGMHEKTASADETA